MNKPKKNILNMYFVVIDRTNHPIRSFDTYHEADMFRASYNRWDWLIVCKDYVSTQKQRSAVKFCEHILDVEFSGNLESGISCSKFLSEYLTLAKQHINELKSEYETDRGY